MQATNSTTRVASVRVAVIISTIVLALVLLLASSVGASHSPVVTDAYRVQPGDTLWDIAAERTHENRDVRDTIAAIRSMNRMTSSMLQPGQVLEVPAG